MIEELAPADADAALAVVLESFDAAVAPDYSPEGVALFRRVVTADYVRSLPTRHGFTLVERRDGRITGLCAIRDRNHITLFFVRPEAQGRGVGRRLFDATLARQLAPREGGRGPVFAHRGAGVRGARLPPQRRRARRRWHPLHPDDSPALVGTPVMPWRVTAADEADPAP